MKALPPTYMVLFGYGDFSSQAALSALQLVADNSRASGYYELLAKIRPDNQAAARLLEGVGPQWDLMISPGPPDSAIWRARENVITAFVHTLKQYQVLVWADRDIKYTPQTIIDIVGLCQLTRGIVGAPVSKRCHGQGIASLTKLPAIDPVNPQLAPAWYVGAGLAAYHRDCLEAICSRFQIVDPGYYPCCHPMVVDHPFSPGRKLDLTEDWVLSYLARQAGYESYILSTAATGHEDGDGTVYTLYSSDTRQKNKPVISVIHASRGEPDKCRSAIDRTLKAASGDYSIEYILSIDDDDDTMRGFSRPGIKIVHGLSRGSVDAFNRAAWVSTGQVLCQMHDDLVYPPGWDETVTDALLTGNGGDIGKPAVLHVSDGNNANPGKPWLLTVLIGTAAWFRKCGYFYKPEYPSILADDDISIKALQDGCVIERPDIVVEHQWGGQQSSPAKQRMYSQENWQVGQRIIEDRRRAGFPDEPQRWGGRQ